MASIPTTMASPFDKGVPALHSGDCLPRKEFHRRYAGYPDDVRFELIGGVVFMASPVRRLHGMYHVELSALLKIYVAETPGTEAADNATVILDDENEPQPDLYLRLRAEFGGQSTTTEDDYVLGAPELVVEIAHSTVAIDLHAKKEMYQRAGVKEYLVLCIEEHELALFDLGHDAIVEPNQDGILCSIVFPGLWLNSTAILAQDTPRSMDILRQSIASDEHGRFVSG